MKKRINEDIYLERSKSLISMVDVYFYSLHEGLTRDFFKDVANYDIVMSGNEFDKKNERFFYVIILIRRRYRLRLPKQIFEVIY